MKKVLVLSVVLFFASTGFSQSDLSPSLSKNTINELTDQSVELQRYFVQSDNLMREGQHEQAILMLDEAIGIYPNHSESYLKRAEQLSRIGRLTEARMDMQTAYRLSPNTTKFLQSKGKLDKLQWIAFPEEEYLAYAANHSSFELKTLVLSSLEKKKTGDLVGAILDLELAFLLEDEESAKLHSLRGNLLLLSQNFAAATQSYDRAIELAPDQAYLYFNRGVSRIFSNERSKAGEDLEKSEDLGYKIPYDKLSFFCYY